MPVSSSFGTYLGIPSDFGVSKKEIFNGLIRQMEDRLRSWNAIFLSPKARLSLINSVLSSLGNHVLSVFKISMSIARKMNCIMAKFWWLVCLIRDAFIGGNGITLPSQRIRGA